MSVFCFKNHQIFIFSINTRIVKCRTWLVDLFIWYFSKWINLFLALSLSQASVCIIAELLVPRFLVSALSSSIFNAFIKLLLRIMLLILLGLIWKTIVLGYSPVVLKYDIFTSTYTSHCWALDSLNEKVVSLRTLKTLRVIHDLNLWLLSFYFS